VGDAGAHAPTAVDADLAWKSHWFSDLGRFNGPSRRDELVAARDSPGLDCSGGAQRHSVTQARFARVLLEVPIAPVYLQGSRGDIDGSFRGGLEHRPRLELTVGGDEDAPQSHGHAAGLVEQGLPDDGNGRQGSPELVTLRSVPAGVVVGG